MESVWVGTVDGLHRLGSRRRSLLAGHAVTAIVHDDTRWWGVVDDRMIWQSRNLVDWQPVAEVNDLRATCLSSSGAGLIVGTSGAHLLRLVGTRLEPIDSFERVAGRKEWFTPWGDPPDTRSIALDPAGVTYVNIHVGGIARSQNGGSSWQPTIEIEADVHQVLVAPGDSRLVLAASARGLGVSRDGGESWRFRTAGLHAVYLRAVAVSDDAILVSASSGPRGQRAALYRTPLGKRQPFERCQDGLPAWFSGNIDTFCLVASGSTVVFAAADGSAFRSEDQGKRWESLAAGLPAVRCVAIA